MLSIEMKWLQEPAEHVSSFTVHSLFFFFLLLHKLDVSINLQPFWIVQMRSEECVRKLASRSISLRGAIELWGHSTDIDDLHRQLKMLDPSTYQPFFQPNLSFKLDVETFSNHLSMTELVEKIEVRIKFVCNSASVVPYGSMLFVAT